MNEEHTSVMSNVSAEESLGFIRTSSRIFPTISEIDKQLYFKGNLDQGKGILVKVRRISCNMHSIVNEFLVELLVKFLNCLKLILCKHCFSIFKF